MSKAEGSIGVRIMEGKACQNGSSPKKRQTYYIHTELMEKVKAYAYWERKGVSETVNMALERFLQDWSYVETPFSDT